MDIRELGRLDMNLLVALEAPMPPINIRCECGKRLVISGSCIFAWRIALSSPRASRPRRCSFSSLWAAAKKRVSKGTVAPSVEARLAAVLVRP